MGFLTIQVSEMFRDPAYFRAIREQVVPHLRTFPSLKVWIAGCANGEEFYSLAILFREEGAGGTDDLLLHRHQPRRAGARRKPASMRWTVSRSSPRTTAPRAREIAVGPLYGGLWPRRVRQEPARPGDIRRAQICVSDRGVRRGASRLQPQRADLFRSGAAGPCARPVRAEPGARRFPWGLARREICASPRMPARSPTSCRKRRYTGATSCR